MQPPVNKSRQFREDLFITISVQYNRPVSLVLIETAIYLRIHYWRLQPFNQYYDLAFHGNTYVRLVQVLVVALLSQSALVHAQRTLVTPQVTRRPCTDQVLLKQGKRQKLISSRAAHQKHGYSTLENQPESLINEAILLTLIDDSSDKLTTNGEPNNLYLHLARDGH